MRFTGIVQHFNKQYRDFKLVVTEPKAAARKLSKSGGLGTGVRASAMFLFIAGLVGVSLSITGTILGSLVSLALGGPFNEFINSAIDSAILFFAYFLVFIPGFIGCMIVMFLVVAVLWGIAKLLGGKSSYGKQFSVLVKPLVVISMISAVVVGISRILAEILTPLSAGAGDAVTWAFGFGTLLLLPYLVYLEIVFTAEVNEFKLWKGAVSVLLPLFLLALLTLVVGVILVELYSVTMLGALGLSF